MTIRLKNRAFYLPNHTGETLSEPDRLALYGRQDTHPAYEYPAKDKMAYEQQFSALCGHLNQLVENPAFAFTLIESWSAKKFADQIQRHRQQFYKNNIANLEKNVLCFARKGKTNNGQEYDIPLNIASQYVKHATNPQFFAELKHALETIVLKLLADRKKLESNNYDLNDKIDTLSVLDQVVMESAKCDEGAHQKFIEISQTLKETKGIPNLVGEYLESVFNHMGSSYIANLEKRLLGEISESSSSTERTRDLVTFLNDFDHIKIHVPAFYKSLAHKLGKFPEDMSFHEDKYTPKLIQNPVSGKWKLASEKNAFKMKNDVIESFEPMFNKLFNAQTVLENLSNQLSSHVISQYRHLKEEARKGEKEERSAGNEVIEQIDHMMSEWKFCEKGTVHKFGFFDDYDDETYSYIPKTDIEIHYWSQVYACKGLVREEMIDELSSEKILKTGYNLVTDGNIQWIEDSEGELVTHKTFLDKINSGDLALLTEQITSYGLAHALYNTNIKSNSNSGSNFVLSKKSASLKESYNMQQLGKEQPYLAFETIQDLELICVNASNENKMLEFIYSLENISRNEIQELFARALLDPKSSQSAQHILGMMSLDSVILQQAHLPGTEIYISQLFLEEFRKSEDDDIVIPASWIGNPPRKIPADFRKLRDYESIHRYSNSGSGLSGLFELYPPLINDYLKTEVAIKPTLTALIAIQAKSERKNLANKLLGDARNTLSQMPKIYGRQFKDDVPVGLFIRHSDIDHFFETQAELTSIFICSKTAHLMQNYLVGVPADKFEVVMKKFYQSVSGSLSSSEDIDDPVTIMFIKSLCELKTFDQFYYAKSLGISEHILNHMTASWVMRKNDQLTLPKLIEFHQKNDRIDIYPALYQALALRHVFQSADELFNVLSAKNHLKDAKDSFSSNDSFLLFKNQLSVAQVLAIAKLATTHKEKEFVANQLLSGFSKEILEEMLKNGLSDHYVFFFPQALIKSSEIFKRKVIDVTEEYLQNGFKDMQVDSLIGDMIFPLKTRLTTMKTQAKPLIAYIRAIVWHHIGFHGNDDISVSWDETNNTTRITYADQTNDLHFHCAMLKRGDTSVEMRYSVSDSNREAFRQKYILHSSNVQYLLDDETIALHNRFLQHSKAWSDTHPHYHDELYRRAKIWINDFANPKTLQEFSVKIRNLPSLVQYDENLTSRLSDLASLFSDNDYRVDANKLLKLAQDSAGKFFDVIQDLRDDLYAQALTPSVFLALCNNYPEDEPTRDALASLITNHDYNITKMPVDPTFTLELIYQYALKNSHSLEMILKNTGYHYPMDEKNPNKDHLIKFLEKLVSNHPDMFKEILSTIHVSYWPDLLQSMNLLPEGNYSFNWLEAGPSYVNENVSGILHSYKEHLSRKNRVKQSLSLGPEPAFIASLKKIQRSNAPYVSKMEWVKELLVDRFIAAYHKNADVNGHKETIAAVVQTIRRTT